MSLNDESIEATIRDNDQQETDAMPPRFEKGKHKKKKQARDISPASRYFRKPVAHDHKQIYNKDSNKKFKEILMPINKDI